ncbi:dihydroorotate dehydrogenase-like protein [Candidatus Viridilinea mediisalina]|uniref:Dihydroorotate dehydrogenase n=1 Tax=Candidatus Viridilinea mediisalina TaxID=2024553 RepID=A0A2A6RMS5_9CHLR|nr:dihydroorotate dehydrogenase-like protein [Candidatus Viridilinea mediisalina]PDW04160.1 dihydroorotate dehydrogenase [Candidatus Viridilinea mediisalina]
MPDLSTTYLGLKLKTPLVASASPIAQRIDTVRRLADAGVSAIVMYSLFEEQIIHQSLEIDLLLTHGADSFAEALSYLPDTGRYSVGPERYIDQLAKLKHSVDIPVIGSLNGVSPGGWVHYAQLMEEAGADAVELNIYYMPTETHITSVDLEQTYVDLVRAVRAEIKIPLAVKLSPFFTALPNLAARLDEAGANGLVLFNRFYQSDFDLDNLEVIHNLHLSTPDELRLPLRAVAMLYGHINADMAITSGVHSASDVLKCMMAGAKVAMMASALLQGDGPSHVVDMVQDLRAWMEEHEYESIELMQGSMSKRAVAEPAAFERANYMKVLSSFRFNTGFSSHSAITSGMLYPFLSTSVDDE